MRISPRSGFSLFPAACLAFLSCGWAASLTLAADLERELAQPILPAGQPLDEVRTFIAQRVVRLPPITTRDAWERYAAATRRAVLEQAVFRGELARQWRDTPARVEWLDVIPGGPGYTIARLRYEALPGLWIPALLYQPMGTSGKIPVHLAVNGHDRDGKVAPYKQIRCINLAKRGIASLNVEWFNQGQLRGDGFVHYRLNQLDLCGVSGLAPFYLAMSRGLDLLLALPYADPTRVAVSGLSGGGWQTILLSSLDTRVTLANPVAGYSSYLTRVEFPSDLGDSEQTPNDLATVADYTHLTALLAGRNALITYNVADNCCFASDHALPPLEAAARPAFALYGNASRLRTHINEFPGTHNYEVDNREAFYRVVGETFFPDAASFDATEIPSFAEVKSPEQLAVPLPPNNLDFHQLALAAARDLPRKNTAPTREQLAMLVKYQRYEVADGRAAAAPSASITRFALKLGGVWTVPVVELTRGTPTATTLLVADLGRASPETAARIDALLASGHRVLALDPFGFGEAKIPQRDFLYDLLVATVGERALGLQASQIAAVARWATARYAAKNITVESLGPRLGLAALIAAALEPAAIGALHQTDPLASLHEVIDRGWTVEQKPELFCFGLLESFDVSQLRTLVGPARLR